MSELDLSELDPAVHLASLRAFPRLLTQLVAGYDASAARWRPPDEAWSVVEIVSHLTDEETEDFRVRLRLTLESPEADWPPIDPEGVAVERRYRERDLASELDRFVRERAASLAWLSLIADSADFTCSHKHPKFGPMSAGLLLSSWAAHDLLHARQIMKRSFQRIEEASGGHGTKYAGAW